MRVSRDDATDLLRSVGFKSQLEEMSETELSTKLVKLPDLDLKARPSSKRLKELLEDVMIAAKQEEGIVVTASGEENASVKTEVADEETVGVSVPTTDRWRLLSPHKVVKVTPELAAKFRDMAKFPRERSLTKSRREFLRNVIDRGEWRGNTWASVKVGEKTYRLNGRGSSTAFCDLFEAGKGDIEAMVTVERYECDSMEDAAALWATFDPKQSARSKGNLLQAYAAGDESLVGLPGQVIKLAAAGLGFASYEKEYRKKTVENQARLILDHSDFVVWLGEMLDVKKSDAPHVFRAPVVAAMFKTYESSKGRATEFWKAVRDDCDDPKTDPKRVLRNWLQTHTFGAPSGKTELKPANDHAGYVVCLEAWNACVSEDGKWKPSKYTAKTTTPKVL